jgi:hypothetical protein
MGYKMNDPGDDSAFPSICIPFSKIRYGAANDKVVTEAFVKKCFERYGSIAHVVIKSHATDICHLTTTPEHALTASRTQSKSAEYYYNIVIHFNSWDLENKEAKYVRSVLMSPNEFSNLKLVYDGPWYWKFFAFRPKRPAHYAKY